MTIFIENDKVFGVYSEKDLMTQIVRYTHMVESEKQQQAKIMSPEWSLAIAYGDDIRANHIRTSLMRQESFQKVVNQAQTWLNYLQEESMQQVSA